MRRCPSTTHATRHGVALGAVLLLGGCATLNDSLTASAIAPGGVVAAVTAEPAPRPEPSARPARAPVAGPVLAWTPLPPRRPDPDGAPALVPAPVEAASVSAWGGGAASGSATAWAWFPGPFSASASTAPAQPVLSASAVIGGAPETQVAAVDAQPEEPARQVAEEEAQTEETVPFRSVALFDVMRHLQEQVRRERG